LSLFRRYLPVATLLIATISFYLYSLSGVGLLSTDEPRYAAVGRAMFQTGDWITPRLWGAPWFEKPPLLYWMTATATWLGARPEISARLPVALLSLVFLCVFYALLSAEFGSIAAVFATAGLATSAGWIVESDFCLTDLPLSCFFALAILLLLPILKRNAPPARVRLILSGVCLGLAVLAKGLVPLVLILPAFWFFRRYWREWWLAISAFFVVSLPWYLLVYQRNGQPFIEDFFLKQHFQRFYSKTLEHAQPWYFYVPVLLGILFPWTPLFAWLGTRTKWDERRKFLLSVAVFGVLFFSASFNKLPGYLLPLVPLLFALLGSTFEGRPTFAISKRWLLPCAVLASLIPLIAKALPDILSTGRITSLLTGSGTFGLSGHLPATRVFYVLAPVVVVLVARRSWAPTLLALCVIAGGFFIKRTDFPILDQQVSARTFWLRKIQPVAGSVCEEWIRRTWVYGLSFYGEQLIPPCYLQPRKWHLVPAKGGGEPVLIEK
jgi:4-amino-4-deoxy-L-arabinose transferase-like glycosyltransferase